MHKGQEDRGHNTNPSGPAGNGLQVEADRGGSIRDGDEVRQREGGTHIM